MTCVAKHQATRPDSHNPAFRVHFAVPWMSGMGLKNYHDYSVPNCEVFFWCMYGSSMDGYNSLTQGS